MNSTRELREERARIARQMQELADSGAPMDTERFNRLDTEQRRLKEKIDLAERADEAYIETRRTGKPPNGAVADPVGPIEERDREYRRAFGEYLRRGRAEMGMENRALLRHAGGAEFRDMLTGGEGAYPGATAGFFVPVGFVRQVEQAMKYYGPMLVGDQGSPTLLDTDTGQLLPYPTSNDTTVMGELIAENQQVSTQDVTIGQIMFNAWKLSSKLVKVSLELIEDSAFDMEMFLIKQFSERIGRAANSYLTTGTGTTQPHGIVPAALAGGLTVTAAGSETNDGIGGPNTIGSDDLTNLEHAVDLSYRRGAKYMFSDSTLRSLKTVKDKYGRPLWQTGIRDREPDTINGYEYYINPYMDGLQANPSSPTVTRNTVIFGAITKYHVRRVRQLSVLRLSERFADFGQVAFLGFYRFDGQLVDAGTHPLAVLQNVY